MKKITKLIDNILSNAIKYNKISGFIKINLDDNFLSIEDSGKGIEKDNLKTLFFYTHDLIKVLVDLE